MAHNSLTSTWPQRRIVRALPLIELLNPRRQLRPGLILLVVGLVLWGLIVYGLGQPLWKATCVVVALLLYPAILKWKEDLKLWGMPVMILSVSLVLQTFHTFEHVAQVIQYHILGWPLKASSGLISAANSEWVHFAWNWGVLLVLIYLMGIGKMRNVWA